MAYGRFVQEYRKGSVNGASPVQLIIMLYDGALKNMEAGKHAILQKNLQGQNQSLQKAQKIVMELMSCLDMKAGEDVAKNLLALYTYVLNQLIQANVHDDIAPVDRSMKVFSDLRESWVQVESTQRGLQSEKLAS
ncbi:MAG TPA: flagellar export chaperone FliS [Fimbriimonadaceae bacterium]|jgi:flagellar protein FliS